MQAGDPILSVDVTRIHTDRFVDGFGVFRVCRLIDQRSLLRISALLIAAGLAVGRPRATYPLFGAWSTSG